MHLILLWFGSWKNSMSCYVPSWVKKDPQRFPRALKSDGTGQEILSAFSPQNLVADAKAFRALMQHIHEMDAREKIEWRSDAPGTACPYSLGEWGIQRIKLYRYK
jgi:beta-galactosidase GanA